MYHYKTFHLGKKLGVTHRTSEGVVEKPLKRAKNRFFGFFSSIFQDYIKNSITYVTLICTVSLVQVLEESNSIWGTYTQKITQEQPKIHFSGPTKAFANS